MTQRGRAILGVVLIGVGVVWLLQGIGVLPGSFMSGQQLWAIIGAVAIVLGLFSIGLARRANR